MDLLEALETPDKTGIPCKFGKLLNTVTPEQKLLLVESARKLSADSLAARLRKTEYPIGATTIKLHSRGECGCFV
jgi:hypothetical protein